MHEDKISELKDNIRIYYFKENFVETIKLCNRLYKNEDEENKWFATYMKSLSYKKLGIYKQALRFAKKSLYFIEDVGGVLSHKFTTTKWLIASCHEVRGNINKALEIHEECTEYFKSVGDSKLMIISMFNIAKLQKYVEKMEEHIDTFINNNLKSKVALHEEDMGHVVIIRQMVNDLYVLDKERATTFINKLENEELKINLGKNLVA